MTRFRKGRLGVLGTSLALVAVSVPAPASGVDGFLTSDPPAITLDPGVPAGSFVKAIISSGDTIGDFVFEGIPDGTGLAPGPNGTVNVFVNHEQSRVPFQGAADFIDSSVSQLTLSTTPGPDMGSVLAASVPIGPENGYIRFCSSFMAGPAEGFSRYTFFTGEESNDILDVPAGAPYGPDPALDPQRQAGYTVILDAESGHFTQVAGLGRYNHENSVVVPGGWRRRIAVLSTDDTFSATTSQLYLYLAPSEQAIWQDRGTLWAFRVNRTQDGPVNPTNPFNGANDYLDLQPGEVFSGEFIRVPRDIALGLTDEAPQTALENWSNENNVFQFVRLEDIAYDKNHPRIVYVADTGSSRVVPDDTTGRMMRGPSGTVGQADNGRIFVFEFNARNPRKVDRFWVLAQGDDAAADAYVAFRSPDNLDTSHHSLMVQEDASNARIWRHDPTGGGWSVVATVNDPAGESSGITYAGQWFGPGTWILDVQAHGSNDISEQVGDVLFKRENGQLLLMRIPGS